MAEDRPDRHPEPGPSAPAGPEATQSNPPGGTRESTPPAPADAPGGTSVMPSPDAPEATAERPVSGAPDGTAKMPEGPEGPEGKDAGAEKTRPAPWRGAAAVPPPGPKKRRRFGLGDRGRDEERPEKPLDPTLDLPAPVDPWESVAEWPDDEPESHYGFSPPPAQQPHPTRIDRPEMPHTRIEPPARSSAAPPPQPPARPQAPAPPPQARSQTPPQASQPRYPAQPVWPSHTPPQQPPPPPPPSQSPPARPGAPGVPVKKEKKRKKDRHPVAPPAARPQLPARPAGPPPGYPAPKAMRRRRRRRWPMVLLTMLLLTVGCCCGLPAYFGLPLWQQYPAKASLPEAIADLSLRTGADAEETTQTLKDDLRGEHLLAEGTFAGVYGDPAGKRVTVFGVTGFRLQPESDLGAEMTRLSEQYGLSGVEPVEPGASGGFQRCGTGEADGATVVVCGWADHGSLGTAVFTRRSITDSAALLDRIRSSIITREQIVV